MKRVLAFLLQVHDQEVGFCLQSHPKCNYYNLKIMTPDGKEEYHHSDDIEVIYKMLISTWGHLIDSKINGSSSASSSVPLPPAPAVHMPPPPC